MMNNYLMFERLVKGKFYFLLLMFICFARDSWSKRTTWLSIAGTVPKEQCSGFLETAVALLKGKVTTYLLFFLNFIFNAMLICCRKRKRMPRMVTLRKMNHPTRLTSVQKRFGFAEGTVDLYAEKVCAIAQAESLRYKLISVTLIRHRHTKTSERWVNSGTITYPFYFDKKIPLR